MDECLRQLSSSPRCAPTRATSGTRIWAKVCGHYLGPPRTSGGSHAVFETPWPGDPRVNIQNAHGTAKAYQVRQVLSAIEKKEAGS